MDVVTLAAANAFAASATTAQQAAVLTSRLQMDNEDAVMVVLGDSTSGDAVGDRWVRLVTNALAAQYPAYTVNYHLWDDGAQDYDTAVVIQTGTGSHVLDVYNGSVSGSAATYLSVSGRWALMVPEVPQLVMLNYGHNPPGAFGYRPNFYPTCQGIQERWPSAGIICSTQNPRGVGDAERPNHLTRMREVIELCASEGYGCVNVTQVFLNTPNYTATLTEVDLIHPTPAGSAVWANEVLKHFRRSTSVVPAAPQVRPMRVFIPASQFEPESGGIVRTLVNDVPAWPFSSVTPQGIASAIDVPGHWQSWNVYVVWSHFTGSGLIAATNKVLWELSRHHLGLFSFFQTPIEAIGGASGTVTTTTSAGAGASNAGVPYGTDLSLVAAGTSPVNRPLAYRLRRLVNDVGDTLAEPANVIGLLLVRVS